MEPLKRIWARAHANLWCVWKDMTTHPLSWPRLASVWESGRLKYLAATTPDGHTVLKEFYTEMGHFKRLEWF